MIPKNVTLVVFIILFAGTIAMLVVL